MDETYINTVGLKEASRISKVSLSTLRRNKNRLIELGATIDSSGWQIPVSALADLNFIDTVKPVAKPSDNPSVKPFDTDLWNRLKRAEEKIKSLELVLEAKEESLGLYRRMLEPPLKVINNEIKLKTKKHWWNR